MTQRFALSLAALPILIALAPVASSAPPQTPPAEAAFLHENDAAMTMMMSGMNVPPTGDIDRDFARMMIPHHQGGIDMARALLRYGKSKEMRALAAAIVTKQEEEIASMRRFLGERGGLAKPATPMTMPMGDHHHMTH